MTALTGLLYAALLAYVGGWIAGQWTADFELLLFLLTFVTGLYWLAERFHFLPARLRAAATLQANDAERRAKLASQGIERVDGDIEQARQAVLRQPWWLDWTAGLFPVILVVFMLRSFVAEPFKIPSGSMIPTLQVGDLILVNKFHYGVRLPVLHTKILANHEVERGDVMVFRYPDDLTENYIKRIVGLPGDEIKYVNQQLFVNGQPVLEQRLQPDYYDSDAMMYRPEFEETLGKIKHDILVDPTRPSQIHPGRKDGGPFPFQDNCHYSDEGVSCKVPAGYYYAMGDNRDNSADSRYWGFVPDENIVGKAFFVWMNFGNLKRIGPFH